MDGAKFWAKKADQVKATSSPTPTTITDTPKPTKLSPKGSFLILNGKTNGTTNGTTNGAVKTSTPTRDGKKTDWADSDDDEDFLASFSAEKDPRITTLENTVAIKDERVKELEASVVVKDLRIEELEDVVQEKDDRITDLEADLEADLEEKAAEIEELKKENNEQYLHVQELVAEVDDKDRRIAKLEAEVNDKGAIIRNLEMESESQTQVSADDVEAQVQEVKEVEQEESPNAEAQEPQVVVDEPTEIKDVVSEATPSESPEPSFVPEVTSSPVEEPSTTTTTPSNDAPKKTFPEEKTGGPAFGNADFPTFVTPDTLKVLPPAPKPKKLTFPIDFSKYGKKSAQVTQPAVKKPEPKVAKAGYTTAWGHASKQARIKTDQVPAFNPSLDIRHMSHADRVLYANGPEVTVKMGETTLATLPKYVLMQCSGKAYTHFTEHPDATSITFPAGSMDGDAAKTHLAWMDEMTYQGRVYSVHLSTDPKFDTKNLQICRAARVMGLNNTYVGHFTKQLCDRIRDGKASGEFMSLVCELAYPENDPIFECLANNLVNLRMRDAVQKPEDLAAMMAQHPILKNKMENIEQRMGNKHRQGGSSYGGSTSSRGASKDRNGGKGGNGGKAGAGGRKVTVIR